MARRMNPCQWPRMTKGKPIAGGFFLFALITIGFVWGAATGQAMRGVLLGTAVGAAVALLLWLIDRRRR